MKYEIKNAENAFFKTLVGIVFYIVMLFIMMFGFMMMPNNDTQILDKILSCLCYPLFKEYKFTENLLYIFICLYHVLFFAMFYIYEHICIHSNIATRYNRKKWVIHKYLIGIVAIIIISLIQYGSIYYVFSNSMPSNLKYYLYPIIFRALIMSYVYTFYNMFKTNKLAFIIILLASLYTIYYFNPLLDIVIIIITFIINYLFFDLRLFRYIFMGKHNGRIYG